MAKHTGKGRGRRRRYLRGSIQVDVDLGTLAARTAIASAEVGVLTERAWLSSVVCTHALSEYTQAVDDGPIRVGVAHTDYSTAEIEAWIENQGSWSEGDLIAQEVAKRKIRNVGTFQSKDISLGPSLLNDGNPITTKCGWMLETGESVKFFAYNMGSSALATTDPDYNIDGHANLWPR